MAGGTGAAASDLIFAWIKEMIVGLSTFFPGQS
jgi:hypothetical protein